MGTEGVEDVCTKACALDLEMPQAQIPADADSLPQSQSPHHGDKIHESLAWQAHLHLPIELLERKAYLLRGPESKRSKILVLCNCGECAAGSSDTRYKRKRLFRMPDFCLHCGTDLMNGMQQVMVVQEGTDPVLLDEWLVNSGICSGGPSLIGATAFVFWPDQDPPAAPCSSMQVESQWYSPSTTTGRWREAEIRRYNSRTGEHILSYGQINVPTFLAAAFVQFGIRKEPGAAAAQSSSIPSKPSPALLTEHESPTKALQPATQGPVPNPDPKPGFNPNASTNHSPNPTPDLKTHFYPSTGPSPNPDPNSIPNSKPESSSTAVVATVPANTPPPKKRGRPPKVRPPVEPVAEDGIPLESAPAPASPPALGSEPSAAAGALHAACLPPAVEKPKKKLGRPPKVRLEPQELLNMQWQLQLQGLQGQQQPKVKKKRDLLQHRAKQQQQGQGKDEHRQHKLQQQDGEQHEQQQQQEEVQEDQLQHQRQEQTEPRPPKKRKGRPPKNEAQQDQNPQQQEQGEQQPPRKRRGRPPKKRLLMEQLALQQQQQQQHLQKKQAEDEERQHMRQLQCQLIVDPNEHNAGLSALCQDASAGVDALSDLDLAGWMSSDEVLMGGLDALMCDPAPDLQATLGVSDLQLGNDLMLPNFTQLHKGSASAAQACFDTWTESPHAAMLLRNRGMLERNNGRLMAHANTTTSTRVLAPQHANRPHVCRCECGRPYRTNWDTLVLMEDDPRQPAYLLHQEAGGGSSEQGLLVGHSNPGIQVLALLEYDHAGPQDHSTGNMPMNTAHAHAQQPHALNTHMSSVPWGALDPTSMEGMDQSCRRAGGLPQSRPDLMHPMSAHGSPSAVHVRASQVSAEHADGSDSHMRWGGSEPDGVSCDNNGRAAHSNLSASYAVAAAGSGVDGMAFDSAPGGCTDPPEVVGTALAAGTSAACAAACNPTAAPAAAKVSSSGFEKGTHWAADSSAAAAAALHGTSILAAVRPAVGTGTRASAKSSPRSNASTAAPAAPAAAVMASCSVAAAKRFAADANTYTNPSANSSAGANADVTARAPAAVLKADAVSWVSGFTPVTNIQQCGGGGAAAPAAVARVSQEIQLNTATCPMLALEPPRSMVMQQQQQLSLVLLPSVVMLPSTGMQPYVVTQPNVVASSLTGADSQTTRLSQGLAAGSGSGDEDAALRPGTTPGTEFESECQNAAGSGKLAKRHLKLKKLLESRRQGLSPPVSAALLPPASEAPQLQSVIIECAIPQQRAAQPRSAQHPAALPSAAQPHAAQLVAQLQATQPHVAQPQTTQQRLTRPHVAQPQTTLQFLPQPHVAQSQTTKQLLAQLHTAQQLATQPQIVQQLAKISQQLAAFTRVALPQATQPQIATQPQGAQQLETQPHKALPNAALQPAAQPLETQHLETRLLGAQPQVATQQLVGQRPAAQPQVLDLACGAPYRGYTGQREALKRASPERRLSENGTAKRMCTSLSPSLGISMGQVAGSFFSVAAGVTGFPSLDSSLVSAFGTGFGGAAGPSIYSPVRPSVGVATGPSLAPSLGASLSSSFSSFLGSAAGVALAPSLASPFNSSSCDVGQGPSLLSPLDSSSLTPLGSSFLSPLGAFLGVAPGTSLDLAAGVAAGLAAAPVWRHDVATTSSEAAERVFPESPLPQQEAATRVCTGSTLKLSNSSGAKRSFTDDLVQHLEAMRRNGRSPHIQSAIIQCGADFGNVAS